MIIKTYNFHVYKSSSFSGNNNKITKTQNWEELIYSILCQNKEIKDIAQLCGFSMAFLQKQMHLNEEQNTSQCETSSSKENSSSVESSLIIEPTPFEKINEVSIGYEFIILATEKFIFKFKFHFTFSFFFNLFLFE